MDADLQKIRLGEYESAIPDFDEAIRLKPDFDTAYTNRGRAKNALGQYESVHLLTVMKRYVSNLIMPLPTKTEEWHIQA